MSDNNNVILEDNKKDLKDCKVCHAVSGSIIGSAGIYSLFLRKKHPENRVWLSIVGVSTLTFGLYWVAEPHLLERGWIKTALTTKD